MVFQRDPIEDEVLPSPLCVGVGHVDAFRERCPGDGSVDAEGAGVGEEVENALSLA